MRAFSLWLLTTRITAFHRSYVPSLHHSCGPLEKATFCAMPKSKKNQDATTTDSKGIMMILSPAKTLDMDPLPKQESIPDSSHFTVPACNPEQTRKVVQAMKKRSQTELGKLLSISANLAKTSHGVSNNKKGSALCHS